MANWLAQHMEQSNSAGWQVHARDKYSIHTRRPDGAIQAEISTRPLHYRNDRGIWQPIDTGLVKSTRGGQEYRADGVPVSLRADGLVSIIGSSHQQRTQRLVVFDIAKQQVVKTLVEFGDGITVEDCLLRGTDSFQHTLQVLPDGLREDVTIHDTIDGVRASEWLMLETEIMGASWPDGRIKALPSVGPYRFPQPTLQDATGRMINASMYVIQRNGAQWLYTGVPVALLTGLRFPVTLDPNFTATNTVSWCGESYVDYATAHSTYSYDSSGNAGQSYVNAKSETWYCNRARFAFDTSSAIGVDIVGLVLRLKSAAATYTIYDTIEVTSLYSDSDFTSALTAERQNDMVSPGTTIQYDTWIDSFSLDKSFLTGATTYYGLLGNNDRNAIEPTDSSGLFSFHTYYPPLLVVLYTVPIQGGLLRHPGMSGGMNG